MLRLAQSGCSGVNLHSGGEGYYAPITGEPNATTLRPEYYGMQLAQQFAGSTFSAVSISGAASGVNVYAARTEDGLRVAVVNKTSEPVEIAALATSRGKVTECWRLTALSLDAKQGVQFARSGENGRTVDPYSAVVWRYGQK